MEWLIQIYVLRLQNSFWEIYALKLDQSKNINDPIKKDEQDSMQDLLGAMGLGPLGIQRVTHNNSSLIEGA